MFSIPFSIHVLDSLMLLTSSVNSLCFINRGARAVFSSIIFIQIHITLRILPSL